MREFLALGDLVEFISLVEMVVTVGRELVELIDLVELVLNW